MKNPRFTGQRLFHRVRRLEFCFLVVVLTFALQFLWASTNIHRIDSSPNAISPQNPYRRTRRERAVTVASSEVNDSSRKPVADRVQRRKTTKWVTRAKKKGDTVGKKSDLKADTDQVVKPVKPAAENLRFNPEKEGRKRDGPVPLKVGLPVFVASLPKSGTTSMFQYFNCGGHPASHQWVKYNDTSNEQTGKCIRRNAQNGLAPFQGCGGLSDIFTDTGFAIYLSGGKLPNIPTDCYYPSIQALDAIYEHYPNATIVNVVRDSSSWIESMLMWGEGSLLKRWMLCDVPGLPEWHASREDFIRFYQWHNDKVREFANAHPSLTFVEVQLESINTGRVLEDAIGIPAQCWGRCSPDSVFCERLVK